MFAGRIRFRTIATTKTTATQFCANTVWMISGKIAKRSWHWVKPSPILSYRAAMTVFRCEKPHLLII